VRHESRRHRGGDYRLQTIANSYEQSVTVARRRLPRNDNDGPAGRAGVSWVMEYANFGFSSNDGQRAWQGRTSGPGQTVTGRGVAPGTIRGSRPAGGRCTAADRRPATSSTRTARLGAGVGGPRFFAADAGRNEVFAYQPHAQRPRVFNLGRPQGLPDLETRRASMPDRILAGRQLDGGKGAGRDVVPALGPSRSVPRWARALRKRLASIPRVGRPRRSRRDDVRRDLPDCPEGISSRRFPAFRSPRRSYGQLRALRLRPAGQTCGAKSDSRA